MKKTATINFRCGQCGEQWASKARREACAKCGSEFIQTLSIDEPRALARSTPASRLQALIEELNRKEGSARLKRYAESWLKAAGNGFTWAFQNPELFRAVQRTLAGSSLTISPAVDGCFLTWQYRHNPKSAQEADRRRADKMFADFLSESAGKLRRCADSQCGKFFEATDPRKIYCDGQCAIRVSSRKLKLDAYHETHHAKFRQLLEVLKELRPQYTTEALHAEHFWKEEVIERTARLAKTVVAKKQKGVELSAIDRGRQYPVSERWLSKHLANSGECDECARYSAQAKKILGLETQRKDA
jgi:hypothetical protein